MARIREFCYSLNSMKRFFSILSLLIFFSAGTLSAQIKHVVIPENPRPGEPVTIAVNTLNPVRYATLYVSEKSVAKAAFFNVPAEEDRQSFSAAVLTVPTTTKSGNAFIRLEGHLGILAEIHITITDRNFDSEIIELNQALTNIRTDQSRERIAESNHLWAILSRTGTDVYSTGNFSPPVTSTRRTSFFGDRRIFKYSDGTSDVSIHAGIDYGVPTGTPVTACGPGKVILARHRIVTGNSIVIEHLPGVYSLYYHLDKINIAEGVIVEMGTLLGLSGATGLATGPHLHWEIRVSGENTDPDAFLTRLILDKETILSRIKN